MKSKSYGLTPLTLMKASVRAFWRSVLSALGFVIGIAAVDSARAQSWVPTSAPSDVWQGITSSADGTKLAAAAQSPTYGGDGLIYTSTNSGDTWQASGAPTNNWGYLVGSADGTRLIGLTYSGKIYLSTNSGGDWESESTVGILAMACSADATHVLGGGFFAPLVISTNSGLTWMQVTQHLNVSLWVSFACSTNFKTLAALDTGNTCYTSTNSGATWRSVTNGPVPNQMNTYYPQIACSADGTKMVLVTQYAGEIYTSTNSGASFVASHSYTATGGSVSDYQIASSADGSTLVIANCQYTYISTNSGATWTTFAVNSNGSPYVGTVCSADGTKIFAMLVPGLIYKWQAPVISIANNGGSANLSWPWLFSPSFALQTNSDLTTTNWAAFGAAPTVTNGQNLVTVPCGHGQQFFRLVRQ